MRRGSGAGGSSRPGGAGEGLEDRHYQLQYTDDVVGVEYSSVMKNVAAIGMGLGSQAYVEAVGATLLVLVVLGGLRPVERLVALRSSRSHLVIHARPEATTVEDLESLAVHAQALGRLLLLRALRRLVPA